MAKAQGFRKAIPQAMQSEKQKRAQQTKVVETMGKKLSGKRLEASDELMLMNVVGNNYGDKLCNAC